MIHFHGNACVLAALLFSLIPAAAEHFHLFVLTGQSNSLGVTNGGEADPSIGSDPADAGLRLWWGNLASKTQVLGNSGGAFVALQEQQGGYYAGSATHWGPEIEFARSLYRGGVRRFAVIKASRGGGGNSLWSKEAGGHMYQHLVQTVQAAAADLTRYGHTFEISGLLYVQGESDTAAEAAVAGSRFKRLVDNLRQDLPHASGLHGIIGGIAAATGGDDEVRKSQRAIAETTRYIDYFSNLDQRHQLHDGLHFNKAAKRVVGMRFAQAVLKAGLVSRHYGRLAFIGDSITQGGNGRPSFRYRVFEHLASQRVPKDVSRGYRFVGSVTDAYQAKPGRTADVNGQKFSNVHEGHWGWRAAWVSGRVPLPAGRYGVHNLGSGSLHNWTGRAAEFATADAGSVAYSGASYLPDTVVIKIGINDLADRASASRIRDDISAMIDQLRAARSGVAIHLCQVLYSKNVAFSRVDELNGLLEGLVVAKNTEAMGSPIWLVPVNDGFLPDSMTYDGTHPNGLGERHVGDRVAGSLGLIEMPAPVRRVLPLAEKESEMLGIRTFQGDDVWNSGSYANGWNGSAGIIPSAEGDTDLRLRHTGSGSCLLDGSEVGWAGFCAAPWVVEARLKFEANPNGLVLWFGTGAHRIMIEIHGDRTQDFGGESFNVPHKNLDGQFHTWRVEHDPTAGRYHLWRDGKRLSPVVGAPYDQSASDRRLLLGDSTGASFGDGFDVSLDWIRMGRLFGPARMYAGGRWLNGWAKLGAISPRLEPGGGLRVVNDSAGGSWLEGSDAGWSEACDGPWTLELRMRFHANPNGFALWLGTGGHRVQVEIFGDRTQGGRGQSLIAKHNNLDGAFHNWRIGHDPSQGVYHVWRDAVRLTPVGGVVYDSAGADDRLILGDYTQSGFGDGFDVEIQDLRFDFENFWAPSAIED